MVSIHPSQVASHVDKGDSVGAPFGTGGTDFLGPSLPLESGVDPEKFVPLDAPAWSPKRDASVHQALRELSIGGTEDLRKSSWMKGCRR